MTRFYTVFALFAVLFSATYASFSVPSFGLQTALGVRNNLSDSDFRIRFSDAAQNQGPNFLAQLASVSTFPVLGGQDMQASIARVALMPGASFPTHTHPRASETLYLARGKLRTNLRFEGLSGPRVVVSTLKPGEVTVFPQGLAHDTTCVCKTGCVYIAFFNSADGGVTPAPDFS